MRMGRGQGGVGRDESKKFKPIPAPPRGAGLKFCCITFVGRKKFARNKAKRSELSKVE